MPRIVCLILALLLGLVSNATAQPVAEVRVPLEVGRMPVAGEGGLRSHVQLVWSPKARVLERRSYQVFDPFSDSNFDLFWQPRHPDQDTAGALNGEGILTWRLAGGLRHGTADITAQYVGQMRDGRAEGFGRFTDLSGLRYTGDWQSGVMQGSGHLITASGDAYTGGFIAGVPHGDGIFVDAAGVLHEGGFANSLPDGPGLRALTDGQVIAAVWRQGVEVPDTRKTPPQDWADANRHEVQGNAARGLNVSLSVGGPPRFCCQAGPKTFNYAAFSDPGRFSVFPDDPKLMDQWRGRSNLVVGDQEGFDWARAEGRGYAFLNYDETFDANLPLRFGLRNATRSGVTILGAYLDVTTSHVDRQPMVQAIVLKPLTPTNTEYSIENYGWGEVKDATFTGQFVNGALRSPSFAINVGSVENVSQFSFEPVLRSYNVALEQMPTIARACGGSHGDPETFDPPGCVESLKATGHFGGLTEFMRRTQGDTRFGLEFEGSLNFAWVDHEGITQTTKAPMAGSLPMTTLRSRGECEGGDFELINEGKPFDLDETGSDYQITLPLDAYVQGGEERRWEVALAVAKSSQHRMQIVLELEDGREIRSRDISALMFKPRFYDASIRPFEPRC
ncbi:MAG: hypothetical protein ABJL99_16245 [Aliishimia sp.]